MKLKDYEFLQTKAVIEDLLKSLKYEIPILRISTTDHQRMLSYIKSVPTEIKSFKIKINNKDFKIDSNWNESIVNYVKKLSKAKKQYMSGHIRIKAEDEKTYVFILFDVSII